MPTEANRRLDLAAMPIADKVSRYVQARSYATQLRALQGEAEMCGCHFAVAASPDDIPADVEEHFSFALMVAKSAEWSPAEPVSEHREYARARLVDGAAKALLRDILAALAALNVHFQIGPAGLNRDHIESKRKCWGLSRAVIADATATSLPRLNGKSKYDVGSSFSRFLNSWEYQSVKNIDFSPSVFDSSNPIRFQLESDRLAGPYESPYAPARNISPIALTTTSGPENCSGSEVICTVATASKPADLLRKLIAAIPAASAKQYRVRLSVTAIEEPAIDNTADSSTP